MSAGEKLKALDKKLLRGPWKLGFGDGSGQRWRDFLGPTSGYIVQETPDERVVHSGGRDSWGTRLGLERRQDATALIAIRNALPQIRAVVEAAEERQRLLRALAESPPACRPLELDTNAKAMVAALAALDEALP